MKKSLVVGVSALLLSLVAVTGCSETPAEGGSGATDSQVQENVTHVKDINVVDEATAQTENPKSVKHGEEVFIKGAQIYGRYQHKLYIHEGFKSIETEADIEGIALEVRNDNVDFNKINVGSIVNIKGIVDSIDGHFYIKNAEVTVTKDNPKAEIGPQDPVMILNNYGRIQSLLATPTLNGLGAFTTLQACKDFGPITAEGATIPVVFPGEDTDITESEDKYNYSVMNYVIPAGLGEKELKVLNEVTFRDLTDTAGKSTLKAGQTFTAMTAITWNNELGFEYVPHLGCSNDFGRLGITQNVPTYTDFATMKTEFLAPLIDSTKLDNFPNLEVKDEQSNSLVFNYVPSDAYFNEYGLEIAVNTYHSEEVFQTLQDNLLAQNYVAGDIEDDPNSNITQAIYASDATGKQDYTVYLQRLGAYINVILDVKETICKFIPEVTQYDTFADALAGLNTNVNIYDRRYTFSTVQPLGFESALPDFTEDIAKQGFTFDPAAQAEPTEEGEEKLKAVTLDKSNENYYNEAINIGIAPISQHRITYNFDAPNPEIKKETKDGKDTYSIVIPEDIDIRFSRLVKDMTAKLHKAGFVFSEHQMLVSGKKPNGEYIPAYYYYNKDTGESIMYALNNPTKKLDKTGKPTGDWIGNWGVLIIDEVVTSEIASWAFEPATDLEPLYVWTSAEDKAFKKVLGTTDSFIMPAFEGFDYFGFDFLEGEDKNGVPGVNVIFIVDMKDPDKLDQHIPDPDIAKLYSEQLKAAGWTVSSKIVGEGDKSYVVYTATKVGSELTYEFSSINDKGILSVVVTNRSAAKK